MTSFASDLNILFSRGRQTERVGFSLPCKVTGRSEAAGTGLAEQHPVPESPWLKNSGGQLGFPQCLCLLMPPEA